MRSVEHWQWHDLERTTSAPARQRGQLECDRGCSGLKRQADLHDALDGVAPAVRNSHQTSPRLPPRAELLTLCMSGASRRNVSGAIALKRTIATSRCDDDATNQNQTAKHAMSSAVTKRRRQRTALRLRSIPDGNRSCLTDSYRNGHIDRKSYDK